MAVNEILVGTNAVASIIREGATMKLNDVLKTGKAEGMQLMDDAIDGHLKAGRVSPMEAYMKSIDKLRFQEFLPKDSGIG